MSGLNGASLRMRLAMCSALVPLIACVGVPALANPGGGVVVAGHAIIGPGGQTLNISQASARAIINWQSFSIRAGETTQFHLPSTAAAVLNRVTGPQLSALLGNLYSNGHVYLLNPHGVVIGPQGRVNTAGFIASTLDISNKEFMRGGAQTLQGQSSAGIVVLGTVKASTGDVLLVAAQVDNRGRLVAPNGKVVLAAGSRVLYVPGSDSNIAIEAPAPAPAHGAAVNNSGVIKAAQVQLAAAGSPYALAVNNGGVISAGSVLHVGGHVVLSGGDGDVVSTGSIKAAGGSVTMTGGRVALTGAASVNVAAPSGHGSVTLRASNAIAVTAGAVINANATANGNGGHISIKAGAATQFAGTATATGGPQGGNGGSAEISGGTLNDTGSVDLLAPHGSTGTLLFDPVNIDVVSGDAAAPSGVSGGLWGFTDSSASQISVGAIESLLQSSNLELQASNSLTFDSPTGSGSFATLSSNTGNTLTLTAPTIAINAPISLPNGKLVFNWPDADITTFSTTAQSITSAASAAITAGTLQIAGNYTNVTLNGAVTTGSLQFTQPNFNAFSIAINNAANAIAAVSLDPGGTNGAQSVDIESSSAMALSGNLGNYGSAKFVAGGDLTLQSGFVLSSGLTTVLASTGGVLNNLAGSTAYSSPNGKLRIYSSTNGTGSSGTTYNANGIANGAPTQSGVVYPANPDMLDSVVAYFATTSSLPTLTIRANSFSRAYGQADPTFTAGYSGGNGGGASELTTLPSFRILQGSDINAGSYTIQPYGAASTQDLLAYINGTLTVNPAVLTIAANPASMTYGGTVPDFTAGVSGFVNGDTSSLVSGLTVGSDAGSTPPAGRYTITPSGAVVATPPGGVEPNYSISYQTAAFTVNKAPLDVTAVAASANYGGAIPNFQLNFSGFVNPGDAASVPNQFAAITAAVQGSPVGSYPITLANGNPNSNYSVSYTGANFSIDPVPLTITPNVTRLYGGSLPSVLPAADFSGLVNGDTPNSLTTQPTLNTVTTSSTGVGHYGITASGAVDANYTIGYVGGTLTINPAPLLITPNNESLTYGTSNPSFVGATYSGLVAGDTAAVVSGLTIGTNAVIAGGGSPHLASPVGNYQLNASGASASNYAISYDTGTLTITPAPLVIQANGTGTYGAFPATAAAVTYNTGGLVNGDTLASLTTQPSYTTSATNASGVGLYTILAQGAADPNYTIRYEPGVLTVNPATLTLTPVPGRAAYGATGTLTDTYTVSGLVGSDTLNTVFGSSPSISVDIPTIAGEPAGAVLQMFVHAPVSIDNNYVVNTPYAPLTITRAPLAIFSNNVTISEGQTPTYTPFFNGLANGDTPATSGFGFAPDLTTATTSGNNITYPIKLTGSNANYDVTYTPGSFTILGTSNTLNNSLTQVTFLSSPGPVTPSGPITITGTPPSTPDLTPYLNASMPTITVDPASLGIFGVIPETSMDEVIAAFLADQAAAGHPTTFDQVENDLIDKSTRATEMALLLPYVFTELSNTLSIPQQNWRPDQTAFVNAVVGFINQQRQLAATQAEDDYASWYLQQEAANQAVVNSVTGPEQAIVMAAQSASPPIPPQSLIQEAQLGMYMTNDQAVTYSGIDAAGNDLADMIQNPSHIPGNPTPGTSMTTDEADVTLDAIMMAKTLDSMATGGSITREIYKLSPRLEKAIWPNKAVRRNLQGRRLKALKAKTSESTTTETETETTQTTTKTTTTTTSTVSEVDNVVGDTTTVMDTVKAALSTAGLVLQGAGAAAEVVTALVQVGLAAYDYGSIDTFNASFNQTIAADNTPLTISGLKDMVNNNSTQTYSYLQLMMATSPQALGTTLPPPAVAASLYETL